MKLLLVISALLAFCYADVRDIGYHYLPPSNPYKPEAGRPTNTGGISPPLRDEIANGGGSSGGSHGFQQGSHAVQGPHGVQGPNNVQGTHVTQGSFGGHDNRPEHGTFTSTSVQQQRPQVPQQDPIQQVVPQRPHVPQETFGSHFGQQPVPQTPQDTSGSHFGQQPVSHPQGTFGSHFGQQPVPQTPQGTPGSHFGQQPVPQTPQGTPGSHFGQQPVPQTPQGTPGSHFGQQPVPQTPQGTPGSHFGQQPVPQAPQGTFGSPFGQQPVQQPVVPQTPQVPQGTFVSSPGQPNRPQAPQQDIPTFPGGGPLIIQPVGQTVSSSFQGGNRPQGGSLSGGNVGVPGFGTGVGQGIGATGVSALADEHGGTHDSSHDEHGDGSGWGSAIPGEAGVDYPIYNTFPNTSFSCKDQQLPGYYADVETQCQGFHICHDVYDYKFLCPNGTIFHQEFFVCVWWHQFDCSTAPNLFYLNNKLFVIPSTTFAPVSQVPSSGVPGSFGSTGTGDQFIPGGGVNTGSLPIRPSIPTSGSISGGIPSNPSQGQGISISQVPRPSFPGQTSPSRPSPSRPLPSRPSFPTQTSPARPTRPIQQADPLPSQQPPHFTGPTGQFPPQVNHPSNNQQANYPSSQQPGNYQDEYVGGDGSNVNFPSNGNGQVQQVRPPHTGGVSGSFPSNTSPVRPQVPFPSNGNDQVQQVRPPHTGGVSGSFPSNTSPVRPQVPTIQQDPSRPQAGVPNHGYLPPY